MDVIAEALGMDPIDLRLKNAFVPGDLGMAGTPFLSCELAACLAKGTELIDWENRQPTGSQPGTMKRGLGVATELHSATAYPETRETANAVVVINEDGTVQLPDRRGGPGHRRQDGLRAGRGRGVGRALRRHPRHGG